MSFPRYPEYKDSGVEWLGEVPGHWEVARLNTIASCNDEVLLESTPEDYEIEYVEISGVQAGQGITETTTLPFGNAPSRARRVVREGDVLISTVRTYLRAIAQVKSLPANMIASTGFAVLRPRRIESGFLGYACHAEGFVSEVIARSVGVSYPAINASELARLPLPLPTEPEQTAIATFLDRETAKIDALVAEQEKLIALLQEKRQAVISHAVTKGLDPNVPMKDSGVEWLGEVPAHWEVKRLKYLGVAFIGLTYDPQDVTDSESGTLVLRSSNVQGGQIVYDDNVYVVMNIPEKAITQEGDILICSRNGSRALIGKNALIDQRSAGVAFGAFMTVFRSPLNSYLRWVLNSQLFEFQSGAFLTSTINQLTVSNLYGFEIPLPPESNRKEISAFLETATRRIDVLVAEARTAITLMQERRTALISAAVTGQIDVRGLTGDADTPDFIAASAYAVSA